MALLNGRLPSVVLAPIYRGRLRRGAAKAWNAMNMEAQGRYGVTLYPTGSKSSYRTIGQQWELYNLWKAGRGNLAAYPGTSNHGWGLAVDLASPRMRQIVDQIGAKYGWAKKWSDAPSEWWHLKWRDGDYSAVGHPDYGSRTLRPHAKGRDVLRLKRLMKNKGLRKFTVRTPFYGDSAVAAIKRFQKRHNLKADGIVGPKTWRALTR